MSRSLRGYKDGLQFPRIFWLAIGAGPLCTRILTAYCHYPGQSVKTVNMRVLMISILSACSIHGQSEQALKSFFEGKPVHLKIDMPATHDGVDIHVRSAPPMDFKSYSQRIKDHGVSLRQGDSATITLIRMKGKNIEFQLGGGGYGTFGDDTGSVSLPSVQKSRRETDLEKDIKQESDSRRRDDMKRELSRLQERRRRAESDRRAEEARLREIKKREVYEKAIRSGSRFNIWYPANYLKEAVPTPRDVMTALAEYVEFSAGGSAIAYPPLTQQQPLPASGSGLKRGMTYEQVRQLLGEPASVRDSAEGQLQVHSERFLTANDVIDVDFIEAVVIRYRITAR